MKLKNIERLQNEDVVRKAKTRLDVLRWKSFLRIPKSELSREYIYRVIREEVKLFFKQFHLQVQFPNKLDVFEILGDGGDEGAYMRNKIYVHLDPTKADVQGLHGQELFLAKRVLNLTHEFLHTVSPLVLEEGNVVAIGIHHFNSQKRYSLENWYEFAIEMVSYRIAKQCLERMAHQISEPRQALSIASIMCGWVDQEHQTFASGELAVFENFLLDKNDEYSILQVLCCCIIHNESLVLHEFLNEYFEEEGVSLIMEEEWSPYSDPYFFSIIQFYQELQSYSE